jgi:hypothetical protein
MQLDYNTYMALANVRSALGDQLHNQLVAQCVKGLEALDAQPWQ